MENNTATTPFSKLKGDAYRAYEELPPVVRQALQEALVDWCPLRAREWHLRLLNQQRLRPAQAASMLVEAIRGHDHAEVTAFARRWKAGAQAYPHLAAEATLQRYAGTAGIPAARPVRIGALPAPPKAKPQPKAKPKARPKTKGKTRRAAGRRSRR